MSLDSLAGWLQSPLWTVDFPFLLFSPAEHLGTQYVYAIRLPPQPRSFYTHPSSAVFFSFLVFCGGVIHVVHVQASACVYILCICSVDVIQAPSQILLDEIPPLGPSCFFGQHGYMGTESVLYNTHNNTHKSIKTNRRRRQCLSIIAKHSNNNNYYSMLCPLTSSLSIEIIDGLEA